MTDYKNLKLIASSSPHIRSSESTRTIMMDVIIAMIPALAMSVFVFGFRALALTLVSVAACVFWEWGYRKLLKKPQSIGDLSAVVTGMLLAFVCPVTIPYWTIILGDFFAIVLVKMLFGGLGKNIVNPALAGRAFLFSWPVLMSNWVKVGFDNAAGLLSTADAVTAATPLAVMHQQKMLPEESILDMFLGNIGGCIGETSALLLIIGFIYLLYRKVITARIPLAYIGTVAILAFLFPQGNDRIAWMAAQVFGGGLMLGAIFMATDYVTSPLTKLGQIVYGIGCGVITILIRYFGGYSEGVTYAILCMNACAVLLDKIGRPVKFGAPKKEAAKK